MQQIKIGFLPRFASDEHFVEFFTFLSHQLKMQVADVLDDAVVAIGTVANCCCCGTIVVVGDIKSCCCRYLTFC